MESILRHLRIDAEAEARISRPSLRDLRLGQGMPTQHCRAGLSLAAAFRAACITWRPTIPRL